MKKVKLGWLTVVLGLFVSTFSAVSLMTPSSVIVVQAAESTTAEVSTIGEFQTAFQNESVVIVNRKNNFSLKKNTTNIPDRDLTINGNKGQGMTFDVLKGGKFSTNFWKNSTIFYPKWIGGEYIVH